MMRALGARAVLLALTAAAAGSATGVAGEPLRVGGEVTAPVRTVYVQPEYPEAAKKEGLEGKVVLDVVVEVSGEVGAIEVLGSSPTFDRAAVDAVQQWMFRPAELKGKPVAVRLTVIVEFKLDGKKQDAA